MNEATAFLIVWLGSCAAIASCIVAAVNFDRIAALAIDLGDLPVCITAQMVAAEIYRHPEQWEVSAYAIRHPVLGEIRTSYVSGVQIKGEFGEWTPSPIERRIIFNAIIWRQRQCIRSLLREMEREARTNHASA